MLFYASLWQSYTEQGNLHLGTHDVSDTVHFGTQLHGGYTSCAFDVYGTAQSLYDLNSEYLGAHVVIFDIYGGRVYEGRVITTDYAKGVLACNATGYFEDGQATFSDLIYLAEPAGTNLVRNPSFEVNITDSWTFNSKGSVSRNTSEYFYGSASIKITQPSNDGNTLSQTTTINVDGETEYTFSIFAKNGDLETTPKIKVDQYDATWGGGSNIKSTTKSISTLSSGQWIRYDINFTTEALALSVVVGMTVVGDAVEGAFYVDAVQFEAGLPTTYIDGSLGDGYTWQGTAHDSASDRTNMYPYAKDIIKDAVELVDSWRSFFYLSTFDSRIDVDLDFSQEKVPNTVIETLKYGYSNTEFVPCYFVIYENRMAKIITEPKSYIHPDWYIDTDIVAKQDQGSSLSLDEVYNKVYSIYDNVNDGVSITLPAEDYTSQARYGVREGLLDNGDTPGGLALAEDLRDVALDKYRVPRRKFTMTLKGYMKNSGGTLTPVHNIKAGDIVMFTSLDVMFAHGQVIGENSLIETSGFIMSTDYSAKNNSVKVDIGSEDLSFEVLMSRLGLSGGLK